MADNPTTAKVTARILFKGLMVSCINAAKQFEVGFIPCPDAKHIPTIEISQVVPGRLSAALGDPIEIKSDLTIRVINPQTPNVHRRPPAGDDMDFEKFPDVEVSTLHKHKVTVDTKLLKARLAVTAGELYTQKLHPGNYDLWSWTDPDDKVPSKKVGPFGKLVDELGLNVVCKDGKDSGLVILGKSGTPITLPKLSGDAHYEIVIDCHCEIATGQDAFPSDFRLYYSTGVITDPDGLKFDFKKGVRTFDPSPQICEGLFLGRTTTLGLAVNAFAPEQSSREKEY
ncbi:MAG TPA: hypothetical protein VKA60_24175 [Blastocatellia bacterium]|nr:hypothetical protein [Blastocatellia bacterium]